MLLRFLWVIFFTFIIIQPVMAARECGTEWQWANPTPQGNNLTDIAWSSEQKQFITVGFYGTILSSSDSINWQSQTVATSGALMSIVWNGKLWVTVGYDFDAGAGIILSSSDGVNWQEQRANTQHHLNAIGWNGKQWVTVGENGTILTSQNAVDWQPRASGTTHILADIGWDGKQWVAVGENGTILASKNAVEWQSQSSEMSDNIEAIGWNGEYWAAVGKAGNILTSHNGIDWQIQYSDMFSLFFNISWNGSHWTALGYSYDGFFSLESVILSSSDGINWEVQYTRNVNILTSITWNGERWVAVGFSGTILTSHDAQDWQELSYGTSKGFNAVQWGDNQWVAVGYDFDKETGTILTSIDGFDWDEHYTGIGNTLSDIAWNGSQWVAVGFYGSVLTSSNANSWQTHYIEESISLNAVAWNGNDWMAVGYDSDKQESAIISSSNGIAWHKVSSGLPDTILSDIRWDKTQWIAVGEYGVILTSSDGTNWKRQKSGVTNMLNAIAWDESKWVAVGEDGLILTSTDSIKWQKQSSGTLNHLNAVAWNGSQWIAVGYDDAFQTESIILTSIDAVNWQTQHSKTSNPLFDIAWNNKQWVAVAANSGTILTSNCFSEVNFNNTHAIIIAGGGNPSDPLWEATNSNANFAYQTLRYRGINKDNIRYFNAQTEQDVDGDGDSRNDIYAAPTSKNIQDALKNWAGSHVDTSTPLLLYMIDHGGQDIFYVDKQASSYADIFTSQQLAEWLNELQNKTGARVTTIYDACNSGSFMDDLKVPEGKQYERINLFSSKPEQAAYFGARGRVSFSNFFWAETSRGHDVRQAFRSTQVAVRSTTGNKGNEYQVAIMDDNGDGRYDSHADGALARNTHLGIHASTAAVFPEIFETQGDISLKAYNAIEIYAKVDLPASQISRTWVVVVPPDSPILGSTPVTELEEVEFGYNPNTQRYEGVIRNLNINGRYILSYFTQSKEGRVSSPKVVFANVSDGGSSSCTSETAEISLNDWMLHIGVLDYQPFFGEGLTVYDVGLKYREGSIPLVFDVAYVENPNGNKNCSSSRASLGYSGVLSLPTLRVRDTGNQDIILDNLNFRMVPGANPAFELIQ